LNLYGSYTSPFVRHCRVALAQSGLDFEFIEADDAMRKEMSATDKVPFFTDGDLTLTDSSSILKYVREKSGSEFLADIVDYENFTLVNTLLDSAINLFLFENEGYRPDRVKYLERQKNRIEHGLDILNMRFNPDQGITQDSGLRCACFIDWALFRKRFSIDGLPNLEGLMAVANQDEVFKSTAPFV